MQCNADKCYSFFLNVKTVWKIQDLCSQFVLYVYVATADSRVATTISFAPSVLHLVLALTRYVESLHTYLLIKFQHEIP